MFQVSLESAVLFWDIAPTNKRSVMEQIRALNECCDLGALAGMIVGTHPTLGLHAWAESVRETLGKVVPQTGQYPILVNADLDHLAPTWIIPYADEICVDGDVGLVSPRS
jgi:muramoyltetrapeptide carboxypeptidase LdcA involved in peptidoglycan recycling